MSNTPSPTDSELLADSPRDLSELVDPQSAKTYYQTVYISPESSQDTIILPENMDLQQQFSQGITIPNPTFEQAVNTPLPPSPTVQQFSTSFGIFQQWSGLQKQTINDHISYHEEYLRVLQKMKTEGPSANQKLPKLPSQPKRKLNELYKTKEKKAKKTRTPEELHEFLKANEVDTLVKVRKEAFFVNLHEINSSNAAIEKLKEGYRQIQRHQATGLFFYVTYGSLLQTCYSFYEAEKETVNKVLKWDDWLKTTIGICPSYARRLREISRILSPYPRFSGIGLSFYQIFNMRKEIKTMLEYSEHISNYWKKEAITYPDSKQKSSQEV